MTNDFIKIQGAKEHNLKNVSVDIPKNKLVVITGLSGSGKSSLAFDTIYAEGQRRYVESLSAYARGFLDLMKKPDVDSISGLSPAISIEQKTTSKNPRSTVGTLTEVYDYMRLLWAKIGIPYSPATGLPITPQSPSDIVDDILKMPTGTKIYLLSPILKNSKGTGTKEVQTAQKKGFERVRIDGDILEADDFNPLDKNLNHCIEIVVDRLIIKPDIIKRLTDSVEQALNLSDGILYIQNLSDNQIKIYSTKFACPVSGFTITDIEPRLFSFNNPTGACPECKGLGVKLFIDPDLVIPDPNLSISEGAIAPWCSSSGQMYEWYEWELNKLIPILDLNINTPWEKLADNTKKALLYGNKKFEGIIPNLSRRYIETDSEWVRGEIEKYQNNIPCSACHGDRLNPQALCIKIHHKTISDLTHYSISDALNWFSELSKNLSDIQKEISDRILGEIISRLSFLQNVGLSYLTLDRLAGSLSGGEAQRIRLASQIGSGLTGVLYVLDEPSIGLHQRDNDRLLSSLFNLRNIGNTVIVVEHDEDAIRSADYIIDMGPLAGQKGGQIIAHGTPKQVFKNKFSLTAQYINGIKEISVPSVRRSGNGNFLSLSGACKNNLKDVSIQIPLNTLTCITGVSGSGKSSLIIQTLYPVLKQLLSNRKITVKDFKEIKGYDNIQQIIQIDQSPIGRTPRSNPATYVGMFTPIREWFAALPESKERGYTASRFSFNVKGGRCENCNGDGMIKIEMQFLPDLFVECDHCHGKHYNRETLEVLYKGKSIADVLNMTVDEASDFFSSIPTIRNKCELLKDMGLGYITLGQSATTLSGGEAQRIKLAKELSKRTKEKCIYILDEPTTGLHFDDINKLLKVLNELVKKGHTVVIIEHNLDVIKCADYIIDMGPSGGIGGGYIVAQGTPEEITRCPESYTGQYLKSKL